MVVVQYMPLIISLYTSSNTDTVISTALAALASASKLSPLDPSFCNTSLFPDITSSEEPAGIVAFLTIKTSFDPSSLSMKILTVTPEVDLFAQVIPITIDSKAALPDPAGTA